MPTNRLRLVFMGSPDFAAPVLAALLEAGHDVACVYSQPPRPAGRGHRERPCPVDELARKRGLMVRTPPSLKGEEARRAFAALGADAGVVAAYGLILPRPVLEAPRLGCFNVHASLLPRWRGAAPIQHAILAGDAETGITIMAIDEGLDTGPVVLAEATPIGPATTAGQLHDTLRAIGARLIVEALDGVAAGTLVPRSQLAGGATYAGKLDRGDGRLDWRRPAAELERRVRALNPWPGTWFEHRGERLKVLAADLEAGAAEAGVEPGTVIDDRLLVACAAGALRPRRLQRPGRAAADAGAFLRGYPLPAGTRLG